MRQHLWPLSFVSTSLSPCRIGGGAGIPPAIGKCVVGPATREVSGCFLQAGRYRDFEFQKGVPGVLPPVDCSSYPR